MTASFDANYKSRFYHIYSDPDVKTDVNRKAEPQVPLPGLVVNGYYFLGKDWLETARAWKKAKAANAARDDNGGEHDEHGGPRGVRLHAQANQYRRALRPESAFFTLTRTF